MSSEVTFLELVVRSAVALILVLGLVYATFAVIRRLRDYLDSSATPFEKLPVPWRTGAGAQDGAVQARPASARINVLDRKRLSQEHSAYLVEVAGRRFLLGGGERLELLADMGYVDGADGEPGGGAPKGSPSAAGTGPEGRRGTGDFARILEETEHRD